MARRRKSKPTSSKPGERGKRQRTKDRYDHAREDARLEGVIPVVPEVAPKPERVDPSSQNEVRFPRLIGQAIRRGWAVADEKKPGLVDELIEVVEDEEASPMAKIFAFNALVKGDQVQHDKDQQYIRLDRVLEMWRGILSAIRNHVTDPLLVKAIVADVLRFLPPPAAGLELIEGFCETNTLEEGVTGL